ncbi:MAG: host attachment protein [Bdellovibrio bacteriovorus]
MKTWVVVASAARARIFEVSGRREPLLEIKDLVNPEDRLQSQALKSDKPGRAFDHMGGQRHAMGTAVDPKEQVAIRFAKQVAQQLDADRHHGRFDDLCVVAPPHFLGLLRGHMGQGLTRTVKGEVTNDLTQQDVRSVREHVAHLL